MHVRTLQKRRRAAALHNAKLFTALRTARSVLDCASPLALFHPTGLVPQSGIAGSTPADTDSVTDFQPETFGSGTAVDGDFQKTT